MSSFSSLLSGEPAWVISSFVHMRGWSVGVNVVLYTSINTKRALKTWHLSQWRRDTTQSILPGLHLGFDPWVIGVGTSLGGGGMKKEADIPLRIGGLVCDWEDWGFHTTRGPRWDLFLGFDASLVTPCSSRLMLLVDAWWGSRPWR